MSHHLVRSTILEDIVNRISTKYSVSLDEALGLFYKSETGRLFSDDESGLYGQSSLHIFMLFVDEVENNENGK
jgi:hypothetical protein